MRYSLADRLKARARQLGINAAHVADLAGVNRSFVYDIMRGRSENPNLDRLQRIADALRVDRNWLLHGLGNLEGESPIIEHPDDIFVAVRSVRVRATMGSGNVMIDQPVEDGRPYHFPKSWIRDTLKARPSELRIMPVEGDSMLPTLQEGDVVLIDLSRTAPSPPGIFVLFDGLGLIAKRLEHIASSAADAADRLRQPALCTLRALGRGGEHRRADPLVRTGDLRPTTFAFARKEAGDFLRAAGDKQCG